MLATPAGPRWTDWEDTFAGPLGCELACLAQSGRVLGDERERSAAALAAYDPALEPEVLDLLVEARALPVAAWSVLIANGRPGRDVLVEARLQWFRARSCGAPPPRRA